ncbi:hypothetical protein G4B88_013700 [Cannabis sativa]|uniref:Uncharacterized protein n=1 Tax=Cannabis sativa TaxID=3483 RepID=A0A7J6HUS6_CANSA|nr:hypothetical protein G4B88_013700 [Cannabis sativa]
MADMGFVPGMIRVGLENESRGGVRGCQTVDCCFLLELMSKKFYKSEEGSIKIPNRCESFKKELEYVKQMWKNRQELKVEDAGIAALFGLECFAWFCAGEIVGRGFTFTEVDSLSHIFPNPYIPMWKLFY